MDTNDELLAYKITRRKNCKRIIIRVIHGKVYVTAPPHISDKQITTFTTQQKHWIEQQLEQSSGSMQQFSQPEYIWLKGEKMPVTYQPTKNKRIKVLVEKDKILVHLPAEWETDMLIKALKKMYTQEAARYFDERLTILGEREGSYLINTFLKKIRVKYLKTAFGLCYAQRNEVVLNTELVMYESKYVDYVIKHELVHFIHQNHSQAFYQEFEKIEPNWKQYKAELNKLHQISGGWARL